MPQQQLQTLPIYQIGQNYDNKIFCDNYAFSQKQYETACPFQK